MPEETLHLLDEGDVVRLKDDQGDFIVYSLVDGISVIKRAPVYDWDYDDLTGLDLDDPAAGYSRFVWPDDIAGIQYRTPLEPQVGDRVLTRWRDGDRSGVHTGFVDEVKGRTYQVHFLSGPSDTDLHWDGEVEEEDILDMNSQRRSNYRRCTCLFERHSPHAIRSRHIRVVRSPDEPPWRRKPVAGRISSLPEKGFWIIISLIAVSSLGYLVFR